jgi:hypothetical protein
MQQHMQQSGEMMIGERDDRGGNTWKLRSTTIHGTRNLNNLVFSKPGNTYLY